MWLAYFKSNFLNVTITRNAVAQSVGGKETITKGIIRSLNLINISLLFLGSFQFLMIEQIVGSILRVLMVYQGGCRNCCRLFSAHRCELGTSPRVLGLHRSPSGERQRFRS